LITPVGVALAVDPVTPKPVTAMAKAAIAVPNRRRFELVSCMSIPPRCRLAAGAAFNPTNQDLLDRQNIFRVRRHRSVIEV
jgi:hypothetical protein